VCVGAQTEFSIIGTQREMRMGGSARRAPSSGLVYSGDAFGTPFGSPALLA
jgi:hypothetical protein